MRSIRLLAAVTGTLALASACGGDGGGVQPNQPPVANFTPACTGRACTFDDTSTDDGGINSRSWTFGDPNSGANNSSSAENPSHTFTADGVYNVSLTVTDAQGETSTKPTSVTVANAAPTAGFTPTCNGGVCTFANTSTDPEGTFTSNWDFGDPASGNNTSDEVNGAHTYSVTAVTDFNVRLTVTDNDGATDVETKTITVSPPAGLQCNGVDCTLDLTSRSTVTITLTTNDCQFTGNAFAITQPIQETVFSDGCSLTPGTIFNINGGAAFNANTSLEAQFTQGAGGPNDPPKGPPATRVTGSFPEWTIEFDDGGDPTGIGGPEPDFNDIVLVVHATAVP